MLLGKAFTDRFARSLFPPEHKSVLYKSASVRIIAAVVKTEQKKASDEQEGDIFEDATVDKEANNHPALIRITR